MHLEVMTHSESVHLSAELKTGILAVLTDTSGLGDSYRVVDHHCYTIVVTIILMLMLFIIFITNDHWFINEN
jgi:hypothetical protein